MRATWIFGAWLLGAGCERDVESAPPTAEAPALLEPGRVAREKVDDSLATDGAAAVTFSPGTSGTCQQIRLMSHEDAAYISFGETTFVQLHGGEALTDLSPRGILGKDEQVVAVLAASGEELYVETLSRGLDRYRRTLHRHAGTWVNLDQVVRRGVDRLAPWLDGSVLVSGHCYSDNPGPCGGGLKLQAFGGTTTAPQFPELSGPEGCSFEFTAARDGRILASGGLCRADRRRHEDVWTAVHWSPAGGPVYARTAMQGRDWSTGPLAIDGPERMFATAIQDQRMGEERTLVARFDGAAWTLLPPVAGTALQVVGDAEGQPWLRMADGRVVRHTAAGWVRLGFPDHAVADIGGLRGAWAWLLQEDGALWLRPSGGRFARASLRRPEFGARELRAERAVLVGEELWVTARYSDANGCVMLLRSAAPRAGA